MATGSECGQCPLDYDRLIGSIGGDRSARPSISTETIVTHRPNVFFAAKVRAQGRAAYGRYPLIGDRPRQCLVSDGFETRIGRADKAKSFQTKKFAIHALGQTTTFGTAWFRVWNATVNRHSGRNVGNAAVSVPSNAPG